MRPDHFRSGANSEHYLFTCPCAVAPQIVLDFPVDSKGNLRLESPYLAPVRSSGSATRISTDQKCILKRLFFARSGHTMPIETSKFVVVDVTEQKQGAYFEAGLALGFGKTVIWTVREDELQNVHFDTRQFAHIVWKDEAKLAQALRDVIVA